MHLLYIGGIIGKIGKKILVKVNFIDKLFFVEKDTKHRMEKGGMTFGPDTRCAVAQFTNIRDESPTVF